MNNKVLRKVQYVLLVMLFILVTLYLISQETFSLSAQSLCEEGQDLPVVEIKAADYCDDFGNCTRSKKKGEEGKEGYGLLINPEDLLILTAHHVILDSSEDLFKNIIIKIPGSSGYYQAELLALVPQKDLAILQIKYDGIEEQEQLESSEYLPLKDLVLFSPPLYPSEKVFTVEKHTVDPSKCNQFTILPYSSQRQSLNNRICIEDRFKPGDSGLPVFRMNANDVELVGVVYNDTGKCAEVETLPSSTKHFAWYNTENTLKQGWGKNIKLQAVRSGNNIAFTISIDLYLANLAGEAVDIIVYPFDDKTGVPLQTSNIALKADNSGQMMLDFGKSSKAAYLVDRIFTQLSKSINADDIAPQMFLQPNQIKFVVYAIKQGPQAILLGSVNLELIESPSMPTSSPTNTLLPTITPSNTPTLTVTPTDTPTPPLPPAPTTLSGRIAYSRFNSAANHFEVYIYCLKTQQICQRINSARQPDFSTGGYLVFNGHGNEHNSIIRMDLNYSNARPISLHSEDAHPHWSPDGNSLIFGSTAAGPDHRSRIYRLEDATKQPGAELTALRYINALIGHHPIYLSNRRIAYQGCDTWLNSSNCGIYTVREFGDVEPVRYTTNTDDIPTDNFYDNILFTSRREGNWEVYMVNGSGNIQRLTDAPGCDGMATTAPDGNSIAFMSDRNGLWGIYVMNPDGTNQRPLVEILDPQPQYGCDGIWLEERMSWGP